MPESAIEKYNRLPNNLKLAVSSEDKMNILSELETEYRVDLAMLVVRVMVKDIRINNIAEVLNKEQELDKEKAKKLQDDLKNKIFDKVIDYLELEPGAVIKRTREPQKPIDAEVDYKGIADDIFKDLNMDLGDEGLNNRFKNIIFTRIRDVRDPVQTREMLTKQPQEGGIGISVEKADEIVLVLNKAIRKIQEMMSQGVKVISKKEFKQWGKDTPVKKTDKEFLKEFATQKSDLPPIKPKPLEPETELAPPPPAKAPQKSAPEQEEENEEQTMRVRRPQIITPSKPIVSDIKAPIHTVGEVQEFRLLDLKGFRRIGVNANDIIEKMKQRLDDLAADNYAKKIEAIKAYYKSDLYNQYNDIASQVIAKNKPVKEIIGQMQSEGKEVMTHDEFNKLSEFNEYIRV